VIGRWSGERPELRRLVGHLSARPAEVSQRTAADAKEVRGVVELLDPAGGHQRAHVIDMPRRLHLLLINQSDRRMVKIRVPWWPAVAATLGAILLTVTSGTISRDYARLRHQRATLSALNEKLASNEALLDHFGARVREISDEIETWRRARIVEPLRRDPGPARPEIGRTEDITRLLGVVAEEGDRLRSLEHFMGENGHVLTSLPSSWPVRGPLNSDFGPRRSPFTPSQGESSRRDVATRPTSQSPRDADPIPGR
jgi:hypothetical protein